MISGPIDFYGMDTNLVEVGSTRNCLVTNILPNIFFCVPQKKKSHTGLLFHFWLGYAFNQVQVINYTSSMLVSAQQQMTSDRTVCQSIWLQQNHALHHCIKHHIHSDWL